MVVVGAALVDDPEEAPLVVVAPPEVELAPDEVEDPESVETDFPSAFAYQCTDVSQGDYHF